jgi:hypothetical protein
VSKREAGLERPGCGSRPVSFSGKAAAGQGEAAYAPDQSRRSSGVGMSV